MNVHLASVDGNTSIRLTNFGEYRNGDAMWSPDGARLAFVSNRDGLSEIFQIDTAGETLERMTNNSNVQTLIGWSSDGAGLYFLNYLNAVVYTTMDGTDQQELIVEERGRIAAVDLSPDGKWLVYVTLFREGIQQDRNAFLIGTDGEQRRQILPELDLLDDFVWSPDGQWLAFTADVNGYRQLFRVRSNGGRVEQLTFSPRNHARPDWSPVIDKGLALSRLLILLFTLFGLTLTLQFRRKGSKESVNLPK